MASEEQSAETGAGENATEESPQPPDASRSTSSSSRSPSPEPNDEEFCSDCEVAHMPRRLIICVDGTWMVPDGSIAARHGNASNMFRIWCMVKEGKVLDGAGKAWFQIRAPFIDGVGAVDDFIESVYSGVTGSGFEMKILEVYKRCCAMCAKDEIFMFGYSRGACKFLIVRAVVGLLHHMRSLKPEVPDFEATFLKGLREYRGARDKSKLFENSVFRHLSENTRPSPCIKFLGLIDTVKAVNDDNLYDIDMVQSVRHVRHALALFEQRTAVLPERFDMAKLMESKPTDHSVQEAWFAGSHGNVGGSQAQDGLALWCLHWLVTEAQKQGFATGFKKLESSNVIDPAELISVRAGDPQMECVHQSGIRTLVSDFSSTTEKTGFFPWISPGGTSFPSPTEPRVIYRRGTLIGTTTNEMSGCFIHPSVFLLDHTDANIIQAINAFPFSKELRKEQHLTKFPAHRMFWALRKELGVRNQAEKPRTLVCGQVNAGKSSLIDAVLGGQESTVSHGVSPGQHNPNVAFESETVEIILHDSQGFESGTEVHYDDVQDFLLQRRAQPYFQEQIHCVWYCVSTDLPRIQRSDKKFSKIDFGGVPVILVFTKTDKLRAEKKSEALREHNKRMGARLNLEDLGTSSDKDEIVKHSEELFESSKKKLEAEWTTRLPIFSSVVFVETPEYSNFGPESIASLLRNSTAALTSTLVSKMHANAQEVFLKPKLDEMVSSIIKLCSEKGDFWSCFATFNAEVYRRDLVTSAIQAAARVFQFQGFRNTALSSTMVDILWPLKPSGPSLIGTPAIGGVTAGLAWVAFHSIPIVSLASLPITMAASARTSLQQSNALVFSCAEIIFIFDRIFWFGDKQIQEHHVTAAALHYLKIRPEVLEALGKSVSLTSDITEMGPVISAVVEKYRYRRRKLQEESKE